MFRVTFPASDRRQPGTFRSRAEGSDHRNLSPFTCEQSDNSSLSITCCITFIRILYTYYVFFSPVTRERFFPPLSAACVRTGRRKCHGPELDELRLLSSASGPNGELRRSRPDRARAGVLATSSVAPDRTERTGQRDIRGREMDPGCRQCECPECSGGAWVPARQHADVCPLASAR